MQHDLRLQEEWKHFLDYKSTVAITLTKGSGKVINKGSFEKLVDVLFPQDFINPVLRLLRRIFYRQMANMDFNDPNQIILWDEILDEASVDAEQLLSPVSFEHLLVAVNNAAWGIIVSSIEHKLALRLVVYAIEKALSNDSSPIDLDQAKNQKLMPTIASLGPQGLFEKLKEMNSAQFAQKPGDRAMTGGIQRFLAWAKKKRGQNVVKTEQEIADKYRISQPFVHYACLGLEIVTKRSSRALSKNMMEFLTWIKKKEGQYVDMTQQEIADKFEVQQSTVNFIVLVLEIETEGGVKRKGNLPGLLFWAKQRPGAQVDMTNRK